MGLLQVEDQTYRRGGEAAAGLRAGAGSARAPDLVVELVVVVDQAPAAVVGASDHRRTTRLTGFSFVFLAAPRILVDETTVPLSVSICRSL